MQGLVTAVADKQCPLLSRWKQAGSFCLFDLTNEGYSNRAGNPVRWTERYQPIEPEAGRRLWPPPRHRHLLYGRRLRLGYTVGGAEPIAAGDTAQLPRLAQC